jgi:uncharacterized protein DUF5995
MRGRALTLGVLAIGLALPGSASGAGRDLLPWPQLLPGRPDVPVAVRPHPVPNCVAASLACVDDLLRRLHEQWEPLDRSCDHRALFSLAYIRITKGLRDGLAGSAPPSFRYPEWFIYVVTTFSNRYFKSFDDYASGRPVPESWRIAYDADARGDFNGGQDIVMASNAHTQRDLPFVYAEQGARTPDGASRKHDHDAVNTVNANVLDGLEKEFAARYDPFYSFIDLKPLPLEEVGTLEVVKGWRELAWRNGERLLAARSAAERRAIEGQIELNAKLWAQLIAGGGLPGYRAKRDAFCRARVAATPSL